MIIKCCSWQRTFILFVTDTDGENNTPKKKKWSVSPAVVSSGNWWWASFLYKCIIIYFIILWTHEPNTDHKSSFQPVYKSLSCLTMAVVMSVYLHCWSLSSCVGSFVFFLYYCVFTVYLKWYLVLVGCCCYTNASLFPNRSCLFFS